jgi:carbamoyl-phosphate synthase large subunit
MKEIADTIHEISSFTLETLPKELLREAKRSGFSDTRLARILRVTPAQISALRLKEGVVPIYKRVDTCAAEFESYTPYL